MRGDDIRRFCLPCSEASGRLARRVCVSHEAAKDRKKVRRAAYASTRRTKRAALVREMRADVKLWKLPKRRGLCSPGPGVVLGLNVFKLARRLWGLIGQTGPLPAIKVRSVDARGTSSGRAWYASRRIVVSAYRGVDIPNLCAIVLHELAHIAVGPGHAHDAHFNSIMISGAHLAWGVEVPTGRGYGPSRALERALRAKLARRSRSGSAAA